VELLLGLAAKWAQQDGLGLMQALTVLTSGPQAVLGPQAAWQVAPEALRSQGKHTPFAFEVSGMSMSGRVRATLVGGQLAYQAEA